MRYVIDYCIAHFQKEQEEKIYRNYITDCLRIITENTAHFGKECKYISMRYADIMDGNMPAKDERTSEEIIDTIVGKLKVLGGEDNGKLA